MSSEIHLKRCPSCDQWTNSKLEQCESCGFEIHAARRAEVNKRREVDDIHIPIWRIKETDPTWLKAVKRPIQIVQLLLYTIVGFFIYLSTSLAH